MIEKENGSKSKTIKQRPWAYLIERQNMKKEHKMGWEEDIKRNKGGYQ